MKKMLKKVSKTILIIMLLLAIDGLLLLNCSKAAELTTEKVYQIDYCEKVLKYKGIARGSTYIVYEQDGEEYPAYCVNPGIDGVGEAGAYNVDVNGYITDVFLWRIITNGYPYKSLYELGVENKKEAYLATKQAIYCYLDNRDINEFEGIGEAGKRTLSALKQIWNNALNSTETKISNTVEIIPLSSAWAQDELNGEYISKTYKIQAPAPITSCYISIKGEELPQGITITDTENNPNEMFMSYHQFKILIPTSSLKNSGSFEIQLETKMDTKPVLYGISPSDDLQNYALTAFTYEDAKGTLQEEYLKNEAEIKILKRESETEKPLEGVEFQLINSKEEIIYQSLITDQNGEVIIKNIAPGRYYLKEVRTLEGYTLYDENIEIDINLNEKINVIVNNAREKNIVKTKEETNIEVENKVENIKKLPKTGM